MLKCLVKNNRKPVSTGSGLHLKFNLEGDWEGEMKIIGLSGSPRVRGNSDIILDALLSGAKSKGSEVRKYYLNRLKVRGCQACYACKRTGECKQKDDMRPLYAQLLSAEIWVFATPVYWWGPSAQLKLVLDRMFPFCHPPNLDQVRGKKAVLITASEDRPALATPHLCGMIRESMDYLGIKILDELLIRAYQKGEVKNNRSALARATRLGEKIASGK